VIRSFFICRFLANSFVSCAHSLLVQVRISSSSSNSPDRWGFRCVILPVYSSHKKRLEKRKWLADLGASLLSLALDESENLLGIRVDSAKCLIFPDERDRKNLHSIWLDSPLFRGGRLVDVAHEKSSSDDEVASFYRKYVTEDLENSAYFEAFVKNSSLSFCPHLYSLSPSSMKSPVSPLEALWVWTYQLSRNRTLLTSLSRNRLFRVERAASSAMINHLGLPPLSLSTNFSAHLIFRCIRACLSICSNTDFVFIVRKPKLLTLLFI
jgi:hypothetical protein